MAAKGLLIDITRCVGCGACAEACKEGHGLPIGENDDRLSATTLTVVEERGDWYVRRLCMHCEEPTCASVCPVGAIEKTAVGPVVYDGEKCIGCRYCMLACPFDVPKYQWSSATPRMVKCDMCQDLVRTGGQTRCAEICPEAATVFGDRDELLRDAHRRIAENPESYANFVYGEREVGGTSTLFLLPPEFADLGMRDVPKNQPMPQLTWDVLSKIPSLVVTLGTALTGIWWITGRREEVARVEGRGNRTTPSSTHPAEESK